MKIREVSVYIIYRTSVVRSPERLLPTLKVKSSCSRIFDHIVTSLYSYRNEISFHARIGEPLTTPCTWRRVHFLLMINVIAIHLVPKLVFWLSTKREISFYIETLSIATHCIHLSMLILYVTLTRYRYYRLMPGGHLRQIRGIFTQ